jgi:CHAD domain-containing protein
MEPEQRIDVAAKGILLRLLLTMESKETDIRENRDVECLHDFRVALRRTRALSHQLNGILPQATIIRFKREFDWIRSVSGPARDLDVYLLSFGKFTSYLPDKRQKDLSTLFDFLNQHRHEEYLRVIKVLDSRRYRKIMDDWKKIISKPTPKETRLVRAHVPVILIANESIWYSYRKVLNKGKRIKPGSPASSLHELRKKCKNLRYLIEFFQDMYPDGKIQLLLDNLKSLQNNLGEFQDMEVQQYYLGELVTSMEQDSDTGNGTRKSMKMLINKLKQSGLKVRKKFDTRFKKFSSSENNKLYKKLFKYKNGTGGALI